MSDEEIKQRINHQQVLERRFYKKLDKFYQICYKLMGEDFQKITSQFVGGLDQEENLREILGQMVAPQIRDILQMLGISFPQDLLAIFSDGKEDDNELEEDLMIQVLVEELTKYQDINIARDVGLFPTDEDVWTPQVQKINP